MSTAEINELTITSTREKITELGLANSAAKVAPAGTLIMAMYGQGKTRGRVSALGIDAAMNQACAAIQPRAGVCSRFLLTYLQHHYEMIRSLSNSGGQQNLSSKIIKKIPVLLPELKEQEEIALVARDAGQLVDDLDRTLFKKRSINQGIAQQLLTGRTRLPGFDEPWKSVPLGTLGTFLKGRGVRRDDVRSSGVPCIRYGELYTDFEGYTAITRSFVDQGVAAMALPLRSGDLLFAGSGETREEIGTCVAYVGAADAVAGGDIVVLRSSSGHVNPVYLATLANTPHIANQKARAGQGDAVVHISSRALAAIEVKIPSTAEQDAIAAVIVDADREIAALRSRLAKAKSIKKGMMQQLLTGRTRLP